MSKLDRNEPAHWHDASGKHRLRYPADYEPRRGMWSRAERLYAAHIDEHHRQSVDPGPLETDSELIKSVFAHIECLKGIINKEKLLIVALRQQAARGTEIDEREITETLRAGAALVDEKEL